MINQTKLLGLAFLSFAFLPLTATHAQSFLHETTLVSDQGSARATGYGMNSMIVSDSGKTHVTYLSASETVIVRSRDDQTGLWTPEFEAGTGQDNHAAPTLLIDSQKYLHLIFGPHHGQFRYRKSLKPNDTAAWTPIELFAESGTYASAVIDQSDTIHMVYRGGYSSEALTYQSKSKDGTWSQARDLINAGSTGHIVSYNDMISIASDQSLHITYNFFTGWQGGVGQKVGYLRSLDLGKTWQDVKGQTRSTPVNYDNTPVISALENSNYRANFVVADSRGNGYVGVSDVINQPRFELIKLGRDGVTTRLDLSQVLPPELTLDAGAVASVSPANELWIAASYAPTGHGGWASPGTATALIKVDLNNFKSKSVSLWGLVPALRTPGSSDATNTQPSWLPNLERFTGQNEAPRSPKLLFTSGPANKANNLGTDQATRVYFTSVEQYKTHISLGERVHSLSKKIDAHLNTIEQLYSN